MRLLPKGREHGWACPTDIHGARALCLRLLANLRSAPRDVRLRLTGRELTWLRGLPSRLGLPAHLTRK